MSSVAFRKKKLNLFTDFFFETSTGGIMLIICILLILILTALYAFAPHVLTWGLNYLAAWGHGILMSLQQSFENDPLIFVGKMLVLFIIIAVIASNVRSKK